VIAQRFLTWRDGLVANPVFQAWARRNPLTRLVARRRAAQLFDICAGFVYSQILLACVRLRLFNELASGPRTVPDLATELGLTRAALMTLLDAAAALDLVEWRNRGELCGLGKHGAALLGNPGVIPLIEHHSLLYEDLRDPVALLKDSQRSSNLKSLWKEQPAAYTALMSASQAFVASEVLDAYDFRQHRYLLDVGGGGGTFCAAAKTRAPELQVGCFDLPAVIEHASVAGIATHGGNFLLDPLPRGADIVTLIRVLHDHDDGAVLRLLSAVAQALPSRGTILIAEPMAGTAGARRVGHAYFGFYLLAMGSGKPRTPDELTGLLVAAGFERPTHWPTHMPLTVKVLSAKKC
jgi:demethylspheroidene O-methyltransferase